MIAQRSRIIYINVKKHEINQRDHSDSVIEARVEEDEYEILGIHPSYSIVTMQDLGPRRTTAIVLKNNKTNQVRFVRAETSNESQKDVNFDL